MIALWKVGLDPTVVGISLWDDAAGRFVQLGIYATYREHPFPHITQEAMIH